jgi:hypothetical protein
MIRHLELSETILTHGSTSWITLEFLARHVSGEIENGKPYKHDEIRWFPIDSLPENQAD